MNTETTQLARFTPLPKASRGPKAKTNDCSCGCGMKTAAKFVPGHDSRLRGWALRLERGIVTEKAFPGTSGELKAAKAFLAANGGHIAPHARPSVVATVNKPTDKKLAKRQARAAKQATVVVAEQVSDDATA